jgi:hypothetical protein
MSMKCFSPAFQFKTTQDKFRRRYTYYFISNYYLSLLLYYYTFLLLLLLLDQRQVPNIGDAGV